MVKKIKSINEILKQAKDSEAIADPKSVYATDYSNSVAIAARKADYKKIRKMRINPIIGMERAHGKQKRDPKAMLLSDYEKQRVIKESINRKKLKKPKTQVSLIKQARANYLKSKYVFREPSEE